MKLKHLESLLQQVETFACPKIGLEQYQTSANIAASILMSVEDDFVGKSVMDLGCGSGILTAGPLFLGADFVTGIDIDADALRTCRRNLYHCFHQQEQEEEEDVHRDHNGDNGGDGEQEQGEDHCLSNTSTSACYDLMQADVSVVADILRSSSGGASRVDVVIMNPPFGTRNPGIDITFLQSALSLAEDAVYSLHKSSTRDGIRRRCDKMNVDMDVLAELRFDLPATYHFHRNKSADIAVDFVRFTTR